MRGERIKIAVRNRDEYNYLVSLKYCLQAYVDGVPVLIQQESFPKHNENTTIYEIGCSFIWPKKGQYRAMTRSLYINGHLIDLTGLERIATTYQASPLQNHPQRRVHFLLSSRYPLPIAIDWLSGFLMCYLMTVRYHSGKVERTVLR